MKPPKEQFEEKVQVLDQMTFPDYIRLPEDSKIKHCTEKATLFDFPEKDMHSVWIPDRQLAQDVHGHPYVTVYWHGKGGL